jgi:secondary thiamine-phosphate synthase enzyme
MDLKKLSVCFLPAGVRRVTDHHSFLLPGLADAAILPIMPAIINQSPSGGVLTDHRRSRISSMVRHHTITIETRGKGTYEITEDVRKFVAGCELREGLVNVCVQHTSCSLCIMENADPSARRDLHAFFERLAPEDTPYFVHTTEGPDDMPSHIRSVLTRTSETLPVSRGQVILGTWQGLFLFEHRRAPHSREVVLTALGE